MNIFFLDRAVFTPDTNNKGEAKRRGRDANYNRG
jgi:hypothetical protein